MGASAASHLKQGDRIDASSSWGEGSCLNENYLNDTTFYLGLRLTGAWINDVRYDTLYGWVKITTRWNSYTIHEYALERANDLPYTFLVYPNPATDQLSIYSHSLDGASFSLYSSIGEPVVAATGLSGSTVTIDRGNIAHGLYIYELLYPDGSNYKGKILFK
jgi:hypothetical protein